MTGNPFMWALLAAACWGFAPIFEKTGLQSTKDPAVGVMIRSIGVLLGTLLVAPFFPQLGSKLAEVPMRGWVALILGGILASLVGQLFFYRALKWGEVSRVVPIGASYPLLACILGLLLFKEPLTAGKGLGVVLVMAGIYLLR
jgi:bacterial/archaeal transporter family protein